MASLSEINNPQSVVKAIEEFDRLGRKKFLARYGFKPAKNYLLELNGGIYDTKAIAGAAYGFEHPARSAPLGRIQWWPADGCRASDRTRIQRHDSPPACRKVPGSAPPRAEVFAFGGVVE